MAHIYMVFDFGTDEEKAQQAHHKLQGWKQAFRLDKKLQFKFDRADGDTPEAAESEAKPKPKGKKAGESSEECDVDVKLLVRLYFSAHEKLTEQRWIDRIPSEEPFSEAEPEVIREGEPGFTEILTKFEALE
ncbi:MAG TPA: hypothetical protein VGI16_07695 [Candidatus Acidoferrum sp.]|jgi:hypothetical protein